MAKGPGSTRSGSSSNPKAVGRTTPENSMRSQVRYDAEVEQYAENMYMAGLLTMDPGDAAFVRINEWTERQVEAAIEKGTDYDVMQIREVPGAFEVTLLDRNSSPEDFTVGDDGRRTVLIYDSASIASALRDLNHKPLRWKTRGYSLEIG